MGENTEIKKVETYEMGNKIIGQLANWLIGRLGDRTAFQNLRTYRAFF